MNFVQADFRTLQNFFDLESLGINPIELQDGSDPLLEDFESTVRYNGERYEVKLPLKESLDCLTNNKAQCLKRMDKMFNRLTQKRLENTPVIHELEERAYAEKVSSEGAEAYYMPHHPVIKEFSTSYKIRPVFDTSANNEQGLSLNSCLEIGPNLMPDIVEMLLRIRLQKTVIVSDIERAFIQVLVAPEHRDLLRFL